MVAASSCNYNDKDLKWVQRQTSWNLKLWQLKDASTHSLVPIIIFLNLRNNWEKGSQKIRAILQLNVPSIPRTVYWNNFYIIFTILFLNGLRNNKKILKFKEVSSKLSLPCANSTFFPTSSAKEYHPVRFEMVWNQTGGIRPKR